MPSSAAASTVVWKSRIIDFGLLGTIEIPDITFDAGFREEIDLFSIGKQVITTEGVKTVGGSSFLGNSSAM